MNITNILLSTGLVYGNAVLQNLVISWLGDDFNFSKINTLCCSNFF